MAVFVDTFEAVTGESLPPRKSDTSQLQYLASAVGGVETLLRCMCLYVDRFRHVNAYTFTATSLTPNTDGCGVGSAASPRR